MVWWIHAYDRSLCQFFGSIPTLGSSAPIASGISMAQKLNKIKISQLYLLETDC